MKNHLKFKDSVANTLFVPLYLRASEAEMKNSLICDEKACELIKKVDYNFSKLRKSRLSMVGTALRAKYLDNITEAFIDTHENPVVVNLGCGLDTRYFRVKNKDKAVFYELDIDEVIEFRERFLPSSENDIYLKSSMFENEWMDELKKNYPESSFLFISEGVLMYFTKAETQDLMKNLAKRFLGSEIYFDMSSSFFCNKSDKKNNAVKSSKAFFKMGLDDASEPVQWADNIELKDEFYITENMNEKVEFLVSLIFKYIPIFRKSYGIFGYKFS